MILMPPSALITALQWAITLSGLLVFVLASLGWYAARCERRGLRRIKQNGSLAAAARLHLIVSSTRLLAAAISIGGGLALTFMDDFVKPSGFVAGLCWLAWNVILAINLTMEWRTRILQRNSTTRYEVLVQIDELVAQRIERTAERLERTAERLEREHERLERVQERKERADERHEREAKP
jgi:hypothetical protein